MLGKTYASTTSSTSELRIPGEVGEDRREKEKGDSQVGSAVNLVPRCALLVHTRMCEQWVFFLRKSLETRLECSVYYTCIHSGGVCKHKPVT